MVCCGRHIGRNEINRNSPRASSQDARANYEDVVPVVTADDSWPSPVSTEGAQVFGPHKRPIERLSLLRHRRHAVALLVICAVRVVARVWVHFAIPWVEQEDLAGL